MLLCVVIWLIMNVFELVDVMKNIVISMIVMIDSSCGNGRKLKKWNSSVLMLVVVCVSVLVVLCVLS